MKSRKLTGRFIAYLLVFTLLFQYALKVSTSTAFAASEPTISKKSQDILQGKRYNFNINNKVKGSTYKWKSSDTSVATVDSSGFVKGIEKGKATITCTVKTPKSKYLLTAKVTIRKPAETIEINNKIEKIHVGERYNLNKTILPATSNDKTSWTTSDASIAKPNKNGIFTALKPGQVTITSNTISGEKDSVTIRVLDETNSLTLTKEAVVDGKISLKDVSFDYITIDSSVGDAEIIFDNVKVIDTLEMETNANYTVRALNSEINRVVSLEEEKNDISSFSIDSEDEKTIAPTF
ncbi:MAG: Ig-like domain-containing protein, partial [Herbinix sp.]|nr:Ig-like domain-containing protein [Herbinix sp.]